MTIHTSCMYFFTTANVADVKLETNIVEKHFFAVKEKTTYYTLSLTMIMLRLRTSCFVINDSLAVGGSTILHVNLDACYCTCHDCCFEISSHSRLSDFSSLFFFFSDLFILNTHLKHVSLHVYFYTSVLRVFFSWNLRAIWGISTHETRV